MIGIIKTYVCADDVSAGATEPFLSMQATLPGLKYVMTGASNSNAGSSGEGLHESTHDTQCTSEVGSAGVDRCVRALDPRHEFLNWQGDALVAYGELDLHGSNKVKPIYFVRC